MNIVDQACDQVLTLVRRSLREFIGLPLIVVAAFLSLFVLSYLLDEALWDRLGPPPIPWLAHLLGDTGAIASLPGTVASGMITVTSITVSLLPIAVQQTASTLSTHVYDPFIQRRSKKPSFGFFVGLSVFVLSTLGSANPQPQTDHRSAAVLPDDGRGAVQGRDPDPRSGVGVSEPAALIPTAGPMDQTVSTIVCLRDFSPAGVRL